jgi:hypothetical protein
MRIGLPVTAVIGACLALWAGSASAQQAEPVACAKTRAEVKADCIQFLGTHTWNEGKGEWVLKANGKKAAKTPEGVPTRAQIRAERNKFLAANKWDEGKTEWLPLSKPREVSGDLSCEKTRAEVRADCNAFMKTHRWDELSSAYVPIKTK